MFGFFKSKKEKLEEKYAQLLNESHRLSIINRSRSDQKYAEAQKVLVTIENLDKDQ
ncbi:Lacal_2735 family protein [Reichenbachiella sp.]